MKRYVLDRAQNIGSARVGAISETAVAGRSGIGAQGAIGFKRPVFLLVEREGDIFAFNALGVSVSLDKVEATCPDFLADLWSTR